MTEPKIIFDVATKPFPWLPIWSTLGALASACIVLVVGKLKWWRRSLSTAVAYFVVVMAPIDMAYFSGRWFISRHAELGILASGHYEVVQGPADDFHPMPADTRSLESFTILEHKFSYSDENAFAMNPCFNQTVPHGGPIRAGMMLRVKFVNQCILQIEELPGNSFGQNPKPK